MTTREHIIEKIWSMPEGELEEVADFVEFLLMRAKGQGQTELAEDGMGEYLGQLSDYEEMLAAGTIRWK